MDPKTTGQKEAKEELNQKELNQDRQMRLVRNANQMRYQSMLYLACYYFQIYSNTEVVLLEKDLTEGSEKNKTNRRASRDIERQIKARVDAVERDLEKFYGIISRHRQEYSDGLLNANPKAHSFMSESQAAIFEAVETVFQSGRHDDFRKINALFSHGQFDEMLTKLTADAEADKLKAEKKKPTDKVAKKKPKSKPKTKTNEKV